MITATTVGRVQPDELIVGPPAKSESRAVPMFDIHATGLSHGRARGENIRLFFEPPESLNP
jgi:hypothetical protein